jgi:hypothetical protein
MSVIKDGGPAFGQAVSLRCVRVEMNGDTEWEPETMALGGITVRDYFAAKAMQALLSNVTGTGREILGMREELSKAAYEYADAMLRAREA